MEYGIKCESCESGHEAVMLDENGVLVSVFGKPGRLGHSQGDGFGRCKAAEKPLDPPYLFIDEQVELGLARLCDDDDCEPEYAPIIIDGACIWCGKEYADEVKPNPDQGELDLE